MCAEFVRTRKEESVFTITLDNPPVNALNLKMLGEISEAIKQGNEDPEVIGLVMTGAGNNAFSAGADLKVLINFNIEEATKFMTTGHATMFSVEESAKPVIAAINGVALGGGCELALSCDLRFASDRARFGQTEVMRGLIPTFGGTQRMPRLIGQAKAKELIFSGQIISAQESYRIGLVNKVVPDGEELRAASDYVRMLAAKVSPLALAQAKNAINKGMQKQTLKDAIQFEIDSIKVLGESEDLKEGIQSFLEKRPPKFTGK